MDFGSNEIGLLVESVWASVLGWRAEPAEESAPAGSERFLTGCVPITGAWTGSVLLHCHRDLAGAAAAAMFDLPPAEVTTEMRQDALGELTNIVGGNLKALFSGRCYLGLPAVVDGKDFALRVIASRSLLRVAFRTRDLPFVIEVCERQLSAAGGTLMLAAAGQSA